MARFEGNPIIKPVKDNPWESRYVFNPAMFQLGERIHFIYRAMGEDMISRLGYASSKDGYHIDERLPHPIFEPATPYEKNGCEDPRITVLDDKCVMTYTAYCDVPQIGITAIPVRNFLERNWMWEERIFPFPSIRNKNAVIFPERINDHYVMLHRLDPNIHIAYSKDLRSWRDSKLLVRPRRDAWDCLKIGAAGPPMKIENGWLQIYHGVDSRRTYRLGAMILDEENPEKVIFRSEKPFLEPYEDYELFGLVPNVVFSCGSLLLGDKLLVSYGCADAVIGVSTFDLDEIIG